MKGRDDLKGKKINKLTVLEYYGRDKYSHRLWQCECECGKKTIVRESLLKNAGVNGCQSCANRNKHKALHITHNLSNTKIYRTYINMIERCNKPKQSSYKKKTLSICNEWANKENGFVNFYKWAMTNGYRENLTIDRIDNNKGYSPENCRFTDRKQQQRNRDCTLFIEYKGLKMPFAEMCEVANIPYYLAYQRVYKLGWSIEKTFFCNGEVK